MSETNHGVYQRITNTVSLVEMTSPFQRRLVLILTYVAIAFVCFLKTSIFFVRGFHFTKSRNTLAEVRRLANRSTSWGVFTTSKNSDSKDVKAVYVVGGVQCVPVTVPLPEIGNVTIVEATANAQSELVEQVLLNESINDDIYGAVLWPAASALACKLLTTRNPESSSETNISNTTFWLPGKRILELGAGTGLVSIAAVLGGASFVLATDYQELPLQLLEYAAQNLNSRGSHTTSNQYNVSLERLQTAHLDLLDYQQPLPIFTPTHQPFDLVVAADVLYNPTTARAVAYRAVEALQAGIPVCIADSPGRAGRPAFEAALQAYLVHVDTADIDTSNKLNPFGFQTILVGSTVTGERHELICGPDSVSVSPAPQELDIALLELDPNVHKIKRKYPQ